MNFSTPKNYLLSGWIILKKLVKGGSDVDKKINCSVKSEGIRYNYKKVVEVGMHRLKYSTFSIKFQPLFLTLLLSAGFAHSEIRDLPPVGFGGGVDYKTDCSNIRDDRACDSSNMIGTVNGIAIKRGGSERYISQATSTNPFNSLFRGYASTTSVISKALVATSGDRIYVSTNDLNWIVVSSNLVTNQHYSFTMMNNKIIMAGQESTEPIKAYNILTGSMTNLIENDASTDTVLIRGKYPLASRNYLLVGNCADLTNGTTFYPSRVYYSILTLPSSMTALRFIDYKTDDGEQITGMGELFGKVHIFKPSSIGELDFTVLNLLALGGDQALTPIAQFGLIAPRTLANTGQYYIGLSKDGIFLWDGSRRTRLDIKQEKAIISDAIEPIIKDIVKNGTYRNCSGYYYPKKQQYIFSYEDSTKFPKGRANSVLVYDLITGEWWPYRNWTAETFTSMDGSADNGQLLYGDSADGYVYYADMDNRANDARFELPINSMDDNSKWLRSNQEVGKLVEGTASLKMNMTGAVTQSSMTYMAVLNFGEWKDLSKISRSDKVSFKLYPSSIQNITSLRIDLEINDISGDFDSNFTSVTITSGNFTAGDSKWTTVEIPISSFPILNEWTNLNTELFPFSDTLTFYGIRFVATAINVSSVAIDDLRIVGNMPAPLNASRIGKQFNFGTASDKRFRQVILNTEIYPDSIIYADVFNNFGEFSKRETVKGGFGKELYVCGYRGSENITKMNSVDLSVKESTVVAVSSVTAFRAITDDEKYLYGYDRYYQRLVKIDKSTMTIFVSTYGSNGSGSTQFNNAWQVAIDDIGQLWVADMGNHRIKVHNSKDLSFIRSFGSLGKGTTNFHLPTGIAVDSKYFYVGDDGNNRIVKLDKTNGAFISSVAVNINTFGSLVLANNDKYLFGAYQTISSSSPDLMEVVLEKRDKNSLKVESRVTVYPQNSIAFSTYNIMGCISLGSEYVYISFTDDGNGNGSYYLQKRLQSDFSIVQEIKSNDAIYGLTSGGLSFKPKRQDKYIDIASEGAYLQMRYSDDGLDNPLRLNSQTFLTIPTPIKEK